MTWEYDLSDEALVNEFGQACLRGGSEKVLYLMGVLLSRLKGEKPPFKPGNLVYGDYGKSGKNISSVEGTKIPYSNNQSYFESYQVSQTHFENGEWLITLKEETGKFHAEDFILLDIQFPKKPAT